MSKVEFTPEEEQKLAELKLQHGELLVAIVGGAKLGFKRPSKAACSIFMKARQDIKTFDLVERSIMLCRDSNVYPADGLKAFNGLSDAYPMAFVNVMESLLDLSGGEVFSVKK